MLSINFLTTFISDQLSEQIMYVLFWGGASLASLGAIYMYGNDFVNQPKLAQAKHKSDWTFDIV